MIHGDTDNTIVGVASEVIGPPGAVKDCKTQPTYAAYVNILHPWIIEELIRKKVDDVRVRGKLYISNIYC